MTHWAQLLHFYQPPTQTHDVLRRVTEESYRPLLKVLGEHANARAAINMQGVLTELLQDHGLGDVITSLKELAEKGRIEFVGSAKYHPILPLIPDSERRHQISENEQTNSRAFGGAWRPNGFFPPEMCFSPDIAPAIKAAGHEWLIVSGVASPTDWPLDRVDRVAGGDGSLAVLFRDDVRSNRISFHETTAEEFLGDLTGVGGDSDAYVVTAMDAETFGHHISNWDQDFLGAAFTQLAHSRRAGGKVQLVLPSQIVNTFPEGDVVKVRASSWSTNEEDLGAHNPFPLWKAPGNKLHAAQWEYVDHCIRLAAVARRHAATPEAEQFAGAAHERLQPALHSCQFWWASRRPSWDVSMIHRGLLLLNSVALLAERSIEAGSASESVRREMRWRSAAAREVRDQIEQQLVHEPAP